jgi:hypothetical protein
MAGLTNPEIMMIANRWIGVSGGYLGDFSYNSHAEFYPLYCDLDINPYQLEGTTRERFIQILRSSSPDIQAKILRGVLQRFPLDAESKPTTRTNELLEQLESIVSRLEKASPIPSPNLQITSATVEKAIRDTEILIQADSPISGVDRIHTALHGYMCAVCDKAKIPYSKDDGMAKLFKMLRQNHPSLTNLGPRSQDIERILQSSASILDALNPIRNNASIVHPNQVLLENEEAMLVINVARTLLQYLNSKIGE